MEYKTVKFVHWSDIGFLRNHFTKCATLFHDNMKVITLKLE